MIKKQRKFIKTVESVCLMVKMQCFLQIAPSKKLILAKKQTGTVNLDHGNKETLNWLDI